MGSICQCLDMIMILEFGMVKGYIFDVFFQSVFSDSFIYSCSCVFVIGVFQLFSDSFFYSRSSYQNFRIVWCNYLCVNVMWGMMYYQVSCVQFLEFAVCVGCMMDMSRFFIYSVILFFFSFFGMYDFVGVMNIFVFIRFRMMVGVQICCNLVDYLFISVFQYDFSLSWIFSSDICRQLMVNRMREIQRQVNYIVFNCCMVIYINQLQFFSEVFGNIDNY